MKPRPVGRRVWLIPVGLLFGLLVWAAPASAPSAAGSSPVSAASAVAGAEPSTAAGASTSELQASPAPTPAAVTTDAPTVLTPTPTPATIATPTRTAAPTATRSSSARARATPTPTSTRTQAPAPGGTVAAAATTVRTPARSTAAAVNPVAQETEPNADPSDQATPADPSTAANPTGPAGPTGPSDSVTIELNDITNQPSTAIVVILGMTLLSVAPAVLLACTSFTKILIVLGLTRNALGLQQTPPNQVLAGLALFLSLFVMAPVLTQMYDDGIKPYTEGTVTAAQAFEDGIEPLRVFMLDNTDDDELALLTTVSKRELPANRAEVPTTTLIPAFVLTELKEAFTIGFLIFVPFLVIDMVVAGGLMALGMMMMPPVMVSLPFKLLLFVLVNGWGLVIESLVSSYGQA